jgi:uncharacterized protein with HEPN domain
VSRSDDQRIADILDAATELEAIVRSGRDAFLADLVRVRAVERLLEIIGEAANSLSASTTDEYPDVAWRDITRLRIVLAHHYHRVDPEQVWSIASADIPALVSQLTKDRR